jgi:hypothetical protein
MLVIVFFVLARIGAAQEEKQAVEKAESSDATMYPVPNYGGGFWSRSYLTGIGAGSDRGWRIVACSSSST